MGWGNLRVINEDRVAPGTGFNPRPPRHGNHQLRARRRAGAPRQHRQRQGGNSGVIRPGDVQRMSAGRGVRHSEYNHAAAATAFPADLDRGPTRPASTQKLRAEAFRERRQARPFVFWSPAAVTAMRRLGAHPCRRRALRRCSTAPSQPSWRSTRRARATCNGAWRAERQRRDAAQRRRGAAGRRVARDAGRRPRCRVLVFDLAA